MLGLIERGVLVLYCSVGFEIVGGVLTGYYLE